MAFCTMAYPRLSDPRLPPWAPGELCSEGSFLASPSPKGWSRACTWYKREMEWGGKEDISAQNKREGLLCWRPTPARDQPGAFCSLMQQHAAKFFCMRFHAFLVIAQGQETPRVHISWLWLDPPVSEPRSHTPRPPE